MKSFKIIYRSGDLVSVRIAEAIAIKNDRPIINTKYDEFYDFYTFVLGCFLSDQRLLLQVTM